MTYFQLLSFFAIEAQSIKLCSTLQKCLFYKDTAHPNTYSQRSLLAKQSLARGCFALSEAWTTLSPSRPEVPPSSLP
ncbi:hypothetical protein Plhal304r1_c044g0123961 [Plasmopara halstedii]